jgi:hypothetical protein
VNLCVSCGLDFGSVEAFDAHRVGRFPSTGPSEYVDRLRIGLVPYDDWQPEFGRRCLEEMELRASRRFVCNDAGRWTLLQPLTRARKLARARIPG